MAPARIRSVITAVCTRSPRNLGNSTPREGVFDDAAWVAVSAGVPEPHWAPPANLEAEWVTVQTERQGGQKATQQDIVSFLGLDRMHVSQIAMRLERDGLIERRASQVDLRSKLVSLTPMGSERLTRAMPVVEAYDRDFFAVV